MAAGVSVASPMRILVLGIGNTLLRDEGAGVHAMRQLESACRGLAGLAFLDGGTLSFSLAGAVSEADGLIVLDAAELGGRPGTVAVFSGTGMDAFLGASRKHSVHEVGLLDLLAVSHLTGSLPERRALIGIQPETVAWGEAPSAPVAQALSAACARARELIQAWQANDEGG